MSATAYAETFRSRRVGDSVEATNSRRKPDQTLMIWIPGGSFHDGLGRFLS